MISAICLADRSLIGEKVVMLSSQAWDGLKPLSQSRVTIRFGSLLVDGITLQMVPSDHDSYNLLNTTYFLVGSDVYESLSLKEGIQYKLKMGKDSSIEVGPTIGFLMGDSPHSYSPEYMTKFMDRFAVYTEIQGFICAFAEENIDWDKRIVHGLYYNPNGTTVETKWEYGSFPIPSVIYRRYFHNNEENIARLQEITGYRVFNSSRFSKFEFYQALKKLRRNIWHYKGFEVLPIE